MRSRRRFLKLVALASAATLVPASGRRAARAAESTKSGAASGRTPAFQTEIDKQKKYTADVLKGIRDYELPPASEMAFVFAPLRPTRRKAGAPSPSAATRPPGVPAPRGSK